MDEEESSQVQAQRRDLDWFEFETKMRKLVHELLEPTLRRAQEDRESVEVMKRTLIENGKRLEPLEFALYKSGNKHSFFDEVSQRIAELEAERAKAAHDLRAEMERHRGYIQDYGFEI